METLSAAKLHLLTTLLSSGRSRYSLHRETELYRFSEHASSILFEVKPPTGEPDAGDPPVRFGGRGGEAIGPPYPYSNFNLF